MARNVVYPWLSDVSVSMGTHAFVGGLTNDALAATIATDAVVCFAAAAVKNSSGAAVPVFVPPLTLTIGHSQLVCDVIPSLSNDTRLCVSVPDLQALCNGTADCLQRGKGTYREV